MMNKKSGEEQEDTRKKWILKGAECECRSGEVLAMYVILFLAFTPLFLTSASQSISWAGADNLVLEDQDQAKPHYSIK